MTIKLKKSVAKKLIVHIVLFSSAVTLLLTAFQLGREYYHDVDLLEQRLSHLQESHAQSVGLALWNMDVDGVKAQLAGILRMHDIELVRVVEVHSGGIDEVAGIDLLLGRLHSSNNIQKSFSLIHSQEEGEVVVGTLFVSAGLDHIQSRLFDKIFITIISNSVKTFIVSLFIFFIFYRFVGRHLAHIVQYAENSTICRRDPPLKLIEGDDHADDELSRLVLAINRMRSRLADDAHSQKMIAMGEMMAQVAHDIRSPLSSLQVGLRQLKKVGTQGEKSIQCTSLMQLSASRIESIAADLLKKYQSVAEQPVIFSVHEVLDEIVGEYQQREDMKSLNVQKQYHEHQLEIYGHRTLFQRAINNVIKNAIEAMDAEGDLSVCTTLTDRGYVSVSIVDTGIGMNSATVERVLRGGYTAGKNDGHGIGTTVVREAVESLGGHVEINSKLGQGTQFTVLVPEPSQHQRETGIWESFAASELRISLNAHEPVVVIDDELSMREQWKLIFEEQGVQVFAFSSFEEAQAYGLESLGSRTAIIDYNITGSCYDGIAVAQKLRALHFTQCILCTAEYWKPAIQDKVNVHDIILCPKPVPRKIEITHEARPAEPNKYVLVDDDVLVHESWRSACDSSDRVVDCYYSVDEFLGCAQKYDRETPIYVDVHLGENIRGDKLLPKIHKLGFQNIFLVTSYDSSSVSRPAWLKGVLEKHPPWAA